MSLEERAYFEQLLEIHSRNAHDLQARLAGLGAPPPLHLLNELEYEQTRILALQRQLRPHEAPPAPPGDLLFVNQIEALNAVLNQPQANNFVIDAPAGYGKTRLLKELAIRLAQAGWYVRTVSFSAAPITPLSQPDAIQFVAQHFDRQHTGDAHDTGRRIAQSLRRLSEDMPASTAGSVLILDSIERIAADMPIISYDAIRALLHGLRVGSGEFQSYTLRIILAGRYISQHISLSGDSMVVNLKPFELAVIRQAINAFFECQPLDASFIWCDELARHLLFLTGGHPGMIKQVLMDEQIGIARRQSIDLLQWRAAYLDDIRRTIVEPLIEHTRHNLPDRLWHAIEVLCVFRKIYRYIIKQLLPQEIPGYLTHFELIDDLKKARLIKHVGPAFEDGILRPALARWLQSVAPDRFAHYCQIAHEIFVAQLLRPAEGMTRADMLRELLYLALIQQRATALSSDEELRRAQFHTLSEGMARHIRPLMRQGMDRESLKELFDDLLNSLRADAELAFLFDYTFGAIQSYETFVYAMCTSDAARP